MRVPGLVVADDRLIETIRSDASLERVAIRAARSKRAAAW
jgi:hypothetical protein